MPPKPQRTPRATRRSMSAHNEGETPYRNIKSLPHSEHAAGSFLCRFHDFVFHEERLLLNRTACHKCLCRAAHVLTPCMVQVYGVLLNPRQTKATQKRNKGNSWSRKLGGLLLLLWSSVFVTRVLGHRCSQKLSRCHDCIRNQDADILLQEGTFLHINDEEMEKVACQATFSISIYAKIQPTHGILHNFSFANDSKNSIIVS